MITEMMVTKATKISIPKTIKSKY